ncbi:MAG TPA: dual specificity protein phosphatase family protein [Nitrososphaerales archaeon]|nr:dual specificity protein phosphatase family protein [Nitrososphaerales archaeon]
MGTGGVLLRRVRARLSDRPTGFLWVEQGTVAASGYPASRRQLEWVRGQGVDSVLTLTEDPLPAAWTEGLSMHFEHIPMNDHAPPSLESLEEAVSFVRGEVQRERKVLVHCLAGQGRTMCVLAAYLIKDKGTGPQDAIVKLRSLRPGAVEGGQERAVFDYAESLREGV